MAPRNRISVVKTAQMANTLKLVIDGRVAGSVLIVDEDTAVLRDHRDRKIGSFPDAATAISEFEKTIGFDEIELEL